MGIDLEEMIEKIIDNGNLEDMQTLSELLEDTLEIIKNYDKECYKEFEMKLYVLAYGNHLNKSIAEEIVSKMQPYGQRWNIEETRQVQQEYGLDYIREIDFYIVMNQGFNDFRDIFNDNIDLYVKYTRDFIEDEDAKEGKVFLYFVNIPK